MRLSHIATFGTPWKPMEPPNSIVHHGVARVNDHECLSPFVRLEPLVRSGDVVWKHAIDRFPEEIITVSLYVIWYVSATRNQENRLIKFDITIYHPNTYPVVLRFGPELNHQWLFLLLIFRECHMQVHVSCVCVVCVCVCFIDSGMFRCSLIKIVKVCWMNWSGDPQTFKFSRDYYHDGAGGYCELERSRQF